MRRAMAVLVGRILILLAFWPVPAWAGQLHVQDLLLRDTGVAALVQVVSMTAERLRVLVKRVFVAPGANRDRLGPLAQEGATASVGLDQGVEWTDPQESPIDQRYWNRAVSLSPGVDAILLPTHGWNGFEAAPATAPAIAKIELLFAQDGPARYQRVSSPAQLAADLADKDLFPLAVEALVSRRALSVDVLLGLTDWAVAASAFSVWWEARPGEHRQRIEELAAAARAPREQRQTEALCAMVQSILWSREVSARRRTRNPRTDEVLLQIFLQGVRAHPEERFAGVLYAFDLGGPSRRAAVFAELLSAGVAVAQRAPHTKAALRAFAERHLEGPNAVWIDPALREEYERALR